MSAKLYPVPAEFAARARIKRDDYERLYNESVRDPTAFWAREGRRLDWIKPYTKIKDVSYDARDFRIRWFYDGQLNVSANCLDRQLVQRGDKTAIVWEGDDPTTGETHYLSSIARTRVPVCEWAQVAGRQEKATG